MISQFNIPATLITGAGASRELAPQLARLGARRVLFVTDAFMESSGVAGSSVRAIEEAGITVALFAGVQPDPTDANVRDGLGQFSMTPMGLPAKVIIEGNFPDAGRSLTLFHPPTSVIAYVFA